MDTKQLQETGRNLQKALEKNEPSTTILALLQPLDTWTATEDGLRSSKIGLMVGKCRSSKDPKIASFATGLVNKWKKAVQKKTGVASPVPGKGGLNGVNGTGRSGTSSPAPPVLKKEVSVKKYTVAPEKRNVKEDGVDTAQTGNATRDGCITLIYNGLCFMSEESPDDILAVSQRIEQAAHKEYAPETSQTYKQKMRSLHLNLKMKQNTALRRDVFSGVIEPKRFVTMTSEELKSEEKRQADEKLEKENMNKAMTAVEEKAVSTTYVSRLNPTTHRLAGRFEEIRPHTTPSCSYTRTAVYCISCMCGGAGCGVRSSLRSANPPLPIPPSIYMRRKHLLTICVA